MVLIFMSSGALFTTPPPTARGRVKQKVFGAVVSRGVGSNGVPRAPGAQRKVPQNCPARHRAAWPAGAYRVRSGPCAGASQLQMPWGSIIIANLNCAACSPRRVY